MSGSKRFLLDTNAVIGLLRANPSLLDLAQQADWLGVSIITQIEFLAFAGISSDDVQLFTRFLDRVEIVGIGPHDNGLIGTAIRLRQEQRLKLPDAIILASAIVKNAELVTADQRLLDVAQRLDFLHVRTFQS